MTFCTNCGKQNTSLLKGPDGELYQLEDDLSQWINDPNARPIEKNMITYTTFVCKDCGNLFAIGETDATHAKKDN